MAIRHGEHSLDELREEILTTLYWIVLPLGIAGNVAAHLRNAMSRVPPSVVWNTWFVSSLLLVLAVMLWQRRRIPLGPRVWLFVGSLNITSALSICTMGIHSPTGFLAPAAAALAWFLVGSGPGAVLAAVDSAFFGFAMWLHLTGRILVADGSRLDASLSHWIVAASAQGLAGLFSILVAHRLLRGAEERQRELSEHAWELEERVRIRTESLEKARSEMQAFAYAVSHDLRAPLRAIDGFSRVLAEDEHDRLSPEGQDALRRILAGSTRMNRLIDALLGLSRLDRAEVRLQPVDMGRIVQQLREELAPEGVVWEIAELPLCSTDPDLARIVWQNLLSNSCKFSAGSNPPRVEVFADARDDGIWYTVRDNGTGFDMAHSKHLFRMFQRLHDTSFEGLGIGLATVRRILDRLDGAIEADAAPGSGATFRFRLGAAERS